MPERWGLQRPRCALDAQGSSRKGQARRATASGPGPVRSPTPAFGIFQLFLAPSPRSQASGHFSGSQCQNCQRRLLWGSAQLQACTPLSPHPIRRLGTCVCPHCEREGDGHSHQNSSHLVNLISPPQNGSSGKTIKGWTAVHSPHLNGRVGHGLSWSCFPSHCIPCAGHLTGRGCPADHLEVTCSRNMAWSLTYGATNTVKTNEQDA